MRISLKQDKYKLPGAVSGILLLFYSLTKKNIMLKQTDPIKKKKFSSVFKLWLHLGFWQWQFIWKFQGHLLITLGTVDWGDNPCRCFHCSKIHRATEFIPVLCCDVLVVWPANRSKEAGNDEPASQDQAQLCFSEYTSYIDIEPWQSVQGTMVWFLS